MGKTIANLYRYAEISKAANKRFLDSMCCDIVPQQSLEKELEAVCEKKTVKGKNVSGFNVWNADTFILFETILEGKYLIRGFTNSEIRTTFSTAKSYTHAVIDTIPKRPGK